jgi:hypothetical protein
MGGRGRRIHQNWRVGDYQEWVVQGMMAGVIRQKMVRKDGQDGDQGLRKHCEPECHYIVTAITVTHA